MAGHFHTTLAVDMAGFIRDKLWASHGRQNNVERPDNVSGEYSRRRHSWNGKSRPSAPAGRSRDRKQQPYGETSHHNHRRKRCVFDCPPWHWALLNSSRAFWLYAFHHRSSLKQQRQPESGELLPAKWGEQPLVSLGSHAATAGEHQQREPSTCDLHHRSQFRCAGPIVSR